MGTVTFLQVTFSPCTSLYYHMEQHQVAREALQAVLSLSLTCCLELCDQFLNIRLPQCFYSCGFLLSLSRIKLQCAQAFHHKFNRETNNLTFFLLLWMFGLAYCNLCIPKFCRMVPIIVLLGYKWEKYRCPRTSGG